MKQKIKILHLEDVPTDAELVARELRKENIDTEIHVVQDKVNFVKALKNFSYDIILSDHSLAAFDSLEAIRLVKKAEITVPFILVTATMTDEFAAMVMKEGANDYILKDRLNRLPLAVMNSIEKNRLIEGQKADQKKAIEQLLKSEAFNRAVLNSLSSHIGVIDNRGRLVAVNEAWSQFAIENGETTLPRCALGSNFFNVCHDSALAGDNTAAEVLAGLQEVMYQRRPFFYLEYPCHSAEKHWWFGMRALKVEGDEQLVVISHQDISERKLAENNLVQSESRLKEAQAIARIANWEFDLVHKTEFWSEGFYKMLGINHKDLLLSKELFFSFIHPDDLSFVQAKINDGLKTLQSAAFDFRFIGKDGAVKYVYSETKIEFDNKQRPVRYFGIIQDVTENKIAELELMKMMSARVQHNIELEQFAYIISHNLRAPVANIIGASSVLSDPDLNDEEKEMLNRSINTSVNRLDDVIKDLNQILQLKGNINAVKELVHFSELVDDVVLSIRNLVDKYGIEIRVDFSEIDEFLTLKPYLYSIFYNLISNSIKFRGSFPCIIEVRSHVLDNKLFLTFKDNGIGIDLEKSGGDIFGLYKRFHSNIEGKGMGLFMVKTQVETLGGKISIDSIENIGTEFKIEFEL